LNIEETKVELIDEIFVPSDKDAEYAKACVRTLARGFAVDSRVTMQREDDSEAIEIPDAVFNVLAYKKQQERRSKRCASGTR
jgi:hypothetical protein